MYPSPPQALAGDSYALWWYLDGQGDGRRMVCATVGANLLSTLQNRLSGIPTQDLGRWSRTTFQALSRAVSSIMATNPGLLAPRVAPAPGASTPWVDITQLGIDDGSGASTISQDALLAAIWFAFYVGHGNIPFAALSFPASMQIVLPQVDSIPAPPQQSGASGCWYEAALSTQVGSPPSAPTFELVPPGYHVLKWGTVALVAVGAAGAGWLLWRLTSPEHDHRAAA